MTQRSDCVAHSWWVVTPSCPVTPRPELFLLYPSTSPRPLLGDPWSGRSPGGCSQGGKSLRQGPGSVGGDTSGGTKLDKAGAGLLLRESLHDPSGLFPVYSAQDGLWWLLLVSDAPPPFC